MWSTIPDVRRQVDKGHARGLILRILVPVAVVGLLVAVGHRRAAVVVAVIAGVIVVSSLVSGSARRAIDRAGAWLGHAVGRFLTVALLGATYYSLFTIVSGVLRIMGRDPLHSQVEPERSTYWGKLSKPEFSLDRWQFARESSVERRSTGGNLIQRTATALIVLLLINLGLGLLLHAVGLGVPRPDDPRMQAAAHEGDPWADAYYAELQHTQKQRYAGFLGWRRADFSGEYITVEDGVRRSYEAPSSDAGRPIEVFFFGGSTMWGVGNRDLHTIPSAFARLAESADIPVRVTNYGESGYVSWQEVMHFSELCAMGEVPDLAIFYDGVNDIFVQIQKPTSVPLPQNYDELRERFENANRLDKVLQRYSAVHILLRYVSGTSGVRPFEVEDLPAPVDDMADNAAYIYRASMDHARRIAAAYDVKFASFWQPCVYTKSTILPGEDPMREELGPGVGVLYAETTARVTDSTTVITDALDSVEAPVMLDWCHTNELGAEAVARAIFDEVRPVLERLTHDGEASKGGGASTP